MLVTLPQKKTALERRIAEPQPEDRAALFALLLKSIVTLPERLSPEQWSEVLAMMHVIEARAQGPALYEPPPDGVVVARDFERLLKECGTHRELQELGYVFRPIHSILKTTNRTAARQMAEAFQRHWHNLQDAFGSDRSAEDPFEFLDTLEDDETEQGPAAPKPLREVL